MGRLGQSGGAVEPGEEGKPMSEGDGGCEECGGDVEEVNVEAFEISGKILCADCAGELFETEAEHETHDRTDRRDPARQ